MGLSYGTYKTYETYQIYCYKQKKIQQERESKRRKEYYKTIRLKYFGKT
jgi:hypothetical protein